MREKEVVVPPNEEVEEEVGGRVTKDSATPKILEMGNEEVKFFLTGSHGEGLWVEEPPVLIERPLEVGECLGVVEEEEIVDIDRGDPFPFLQGIEDLLKKTCEIR